MASEKARQQDSTPLSKRKQFGNEDMASTEKPIVQFAMPLVICSEDDVEVQVQLVRLGLINSVSVVHYTTRDATAKAGREYLATQGTVTFNPGDSMRWLSVPVISVSGWNPSNDFQIELLEEGASNAILGRYLRRTRVKVVNNDCFPTQTHQEHIVRAIQESPPNMEGRSTPFWAMMLEYCKWNFQDPTVRKRTIRKILFGGLHNAEFTLSLFLNVYLIDFILNSTRDEEELLFPNRLVNLILASTLKLFTMLLLHICDWISAGAGLIGPSQVMLHGALVERYLNYDESTRKEIHPAEISMGMMSDIPMLVAGYNNIVDGVQVFGRLLAMLVYQFTAPLLFHRHFAWESMSLTASFPVLAAVFLWWRDETTSEHLDDANRMFHKLAQQVQETVRCYRIIADFKKRGEFISRLRGISEECMITKKEAALVVLNNLYYAQWIGALAVAFYTLFGGQLVQRSVLPLGMFLANVSIFNAYAEVWAGIYQVLLNVMNTFPALEHVMVLLNMPIDLTHRRELEENRLQATKTALEGHQDTMVTAASMPLVFENIVVRYTKCGMERVVPINLSGRMVLQQGTMVCLAGPYGEGKSMLLRIIGGAALPDPKVGRSHVPSYLRVLNVAADAIFFKGTLMENLTIDVASPSDGRLERVKAILGRLLLITPYKKNVEKILTSDSVSEWTEEFSEAERNLLNISRALISNPNILCIHKPMRVGMESVELVSAVLKALRDFVDWRGMEQDAATRHQRQPRTCIITSNKQEAIDSADRVYMTSRVDGIQSVEKNGAAIEQLLRAASY
jgi:ABC-type multidrug transport system fused ATPase/permease subunit